MSSQDIPRDARIMASKVKIRYGGFEFKFTIDVNNGPIANTLFEIIKNRKYTIEPAEDGQSVIIRDLSNRKEPLRLSNGIVWYPEEVPE